MLNRLIDVAIAVGVLLAIAVVRWDYQRFLALGPGGTPQTFRGFLRVKVLGLFALRNPYEAAVRVPDQLRCKEGILTRVSARKHDRPRTAGIAPHRQTSQKASRAMIIQLSNAIEAIAPGANRDLTIGTSCFEKHSTGLFTTRPHNQTCEGEIVHVHPSEGSMHMTLHPADANVVLRAGWGERHPLAGVFSSKFLPEGFMMVYAPHSDEEVDIVLGIVRAACWFVGDGGAVTNTFGTDTTELALHMQRVLRRVP